jgi:hypothetical protein
MFPNLNMFSKRLDQPQLNAQSPFERWDGDWALS